MKVVVISDTHNHHGSLKIPSGDLLIHAGDMTGLGRDYEIQRFAEWWGKLPHRHKLVVPGNHDFGFLRSLPDLGLKILLDSGAEIEGMKIWGSPWTPTFGRWAFMLAEPLLAEKWRKIPDGLDILVTHGPPKGILDMTCNGDSVGSVSLLHEIREKKPRYHIFGHIHEGYGEETQGDTRFINASTCDENYFPDNPPVVLEIAEKNA